jgi:hypothetical protein
MIADVGKTGMSLRRGAADCKMMQQTGVMRFGFALEAPSGRNRPDESVVSCARPRARRRADQTDNRANAPVAPRTG